MSEPDELKAKEIKSEKQISEIDIINKQFWYIVILTAVLVVSILSINFFWLDYIKKSEKSVKATGIYTSVNSTGTIIAQDITPEQWVLFVEWLKTVKEDGKDENIIED